MLGWARYITRRTRLREDSFMICALSGATAPISHRQKMPQASDKAKRESAACALNVKKEQQQHAKGAGDAAGIG